MGEFEQGRNTSELRKAFEALPEIKNVFVKLHPTIIWFSEHESEYATSFVGLDDRVKWLNGAWYVFQDQQSKIEQLEKEKTTLHNAFVYMDECRKEWHEGYMRLHKQKTEITRLVQSLRNEFDLNSDCPQVERQIELLEKALRGECE